MHIYTTKKRSNLMYRILSAFIAIVFLSTTIVPRGYTQTVVLPTATILNLPVPGTMVGITEGFTPAIIKGMTIHPDNPLEFDFIVGRGDKNLQGDDLKKEGIKIIKYFLAALTTPKEDMWVNLSPYEKNRIIAEGFGQTEMGGDLLSQDYLLKQLTSSLMYPEDELGGDFWEKVHKKAYEQFGTTDIPMNTFNKIWIVPENAMVYEHESSAFVVGRHLKVMLEQDFVAMDHQNSGMQGIKFEVTTDNIERKSTITTELIREILIPEIEREVNEGENFANLRQIYNSMILATWYKQNLKESLLGQVYIDKNKILGVDVEDKDIKHKIYNQYIQAFKKGVYNYIKEDYDSVTHQVIPRKYFSGGTLWVNEISEVDNLEGINLKPKMIPNKTDASILTSIVDAGDGADTIYIEEVMNQYDGSMLTVQSELVRLRNDLPLNFSGNSDEIMEIKNWPKVEQTVKNISDATKQLILLSTVKNNLFRESVQKEVGFIYAIAYFRQLLPNDKKKVIEDFNTLGHKNTAAWLMENNNLHLDELKAKIQDKFEINLNQETVEYIKMHDETVRRSRGLRLAADSLKISTSDLDVIFKNQSLLDVILGLRKGAVVEIRQPLNNLEKVLRRLRLAEGEAIQFVHLGKNQYYVYEEHQLKRLAQDNDLNYGLHRSGLNHLIQLDMAKKQGIFFEEANKTINTDAQKNIHRISSSITLSDTNRTMYFDEKEKFWRADKTASQIFEIERVGAERSYIATIQRAKGFKNVLESQLENFLIFNVQTPITVIDDSNETELEINIKTVKEFQKKYQIEIKHITKKEWDEEYGYYAKYLKKTWEQQLNQEVLPNTIKEFLLETEILQKNIINDEKIVEVLRSPEFYHTSGFRNRQFLMAVGEPIIHGWDDDAPAHVYAVTDKKRDQLREDALNDKKPIMQNMFQKVGKMINTTIKSEKAFYKELAKNDNYDNPKIKEILDNYFGYDPQDDHKGLIPQAAEEIITLENKMDGINPYSVQRYSPFMRKFIPKQALRMGDNYSHKPRISDDKENTCCIIMPANHLGHSRRVGQRIGDTNFFLGQVPYRGLLNTPTNKNESNDLKDRTTHFLGHDFNNDIDTQAGKHLEAYINSDDHHMKHIQHTHQSVLLVEGAFGFASLLGYPVFNRNSMFVGDFPLPSLGGPLRIEEPKMYRWVVGPLLLNTVAAANDNIAGGQKRHLENRLYRNSYQDLTEVVGGNIAGDFYEAAKEKYYKILPEKYKKDLWGDLYNRLIVLANVFLEAGTEVNLTTKHKEKALEERQLRAQSISRLALKRSKKVIKLEKNPDENLKQEIKDIDLMILDYADHFGYYAPQNTKNKNYNPINPEEDYFYKIKVDGNYLKWQAVYPDMEVADQNGVSSVKSSEWKNLQKKSGETRLSNWVKGETISLENGRSILLDELPDNDIEIIVPGLRSDLEKEYLKEVQQIIIKQLKADGNQMIIWPDMVAAAKQRKKDSAMATKNVKNNLTFNTKQTINEVGGIDLNPDLLNLQIKRDGNGVPLPVAMQPIENMHIEGFFPIIINITPVNLPLLGFGDTLPKENYPKPSPELSFWEEQERKAFLRSKLGDRNTQLIQENT